MFGSSKIRLLKWSELDCFNYYEFGGSCDSIIRVVSSSKDYVKQLQQRSNQSLIDLRKSMDGKEAPEYIDYVESQLGEEEGVMFFHLEGIYLKSQYIIAYAVLESYVKKLAEMTYQKLGKGKLNGLSDSGSYLKKYLIVLKDVSGVDYTNLPHYTSINGTYREVRNVFTHNGGELPSNDAKREKLQKKLRHLKV